ncbi:MAG: cyclic nucleotide-binding domain-containing protein [Opitutales bacterium]
MEKEEEYRPGATILHQGEEASGFYILKKGAVEVYKDDVMLNVLMYPGTIFGEMGYVRDQRRSCTIKARTHTVVTKYEDTSMEEIIRDHPDVAMKIFQTMAARLDRTTKKLVEVSRISSLADTE